MNELELIWKDVVGFEGYYKISNKGDVYSLHVKARTTNIIGRNIGNTGYRRALLYKKGQKRVYKPVHRMVAEAFIENPLNLPYVNHIDGNKLNNHIENLEWCTMAQNNLHAHRTGLKKMPTGYAHAKSRIIFDTKAFVFYYSVKDFAKSVGVGICRAQGWFSGRIPNPTHYIAV